MKNYCSPPVRGAHLSSQRPPRLMIKPLKSVKANAYIVSLRDKWQRAIIHHPCLYPAMRGFRLPSSHAKLRRDTSVFVNCRRLSYGGQKTTPRHVAFRNNFAPIKWRGKSGRFISSLTIRRIGIGGWRGKIRNPESEEDEFQVFGKLSRRGGVSKH